MNLALYDKAPIPWGFVGSSGEPGAPGFLCFMTGSDTAGHQSDEEIAGLRVLHVGAVDFGGA